MQWYNLFRFGEEKVKFGDKTEVKHQRDGELYDVIATSYLSKSDIEDESPVTCVVEIPKSNYIKKETITYDGMTHFELLKTVHLQCADVEHYRASI